MAYWSLVSHPWFIVSKVPKISELFFSMIVQRKNNLKTVLKNVVKWLNTLSNL
jgi:hypothetical protein